MKEDRTKLIIKLGAVFIVVWCNIFRYNNNQMQFDYYFLQILK